MTEQAQPQSEIIEGGDRQSAKYALRDAANRLRSRADDLDAIADALERCTPKFDLSVTEDAADRPDITWQKRPPGHLAPDERPQDAEECRPVAQEGPLVHLVRLLLQLLADGYQDGRKPSESIQALA